MGKIFLIMTVFVLGCGGSLSDEQRKKLHEGMEAQKIVKLSDAEITTASLDRGRVVYNVIEKLKFDSTKIDSIAARYHAKINFIRPGSGNALQVEKQVIEAYVIGAETGSTQDNIQKIWTTNETQAYDSLLYSKPIITPLPQGAIKVEGVWNIYLSKKDVILSITRNK